VYLADKNREIKKHGKENTAPCFFYQPVGTGDINLSPTGKAENRLIPVATSLYRILSMS